MNIDISLSYKPFRITSITSYIVADKRDSLGCIFYHLTNSSLRKISANKPLLCSLNMIWEVCWFTYLEFILSTCNQCMQLWCPFLPSVCLKGHPSLCTWRYNPYEVKTKSKSYWDFRKYKRRTLGVQDSTYLYSPYDPCTTSDKCHNRLQPCCASRYIQIQSAETNARVKDINNLTNYTKCTETNYQWIYWMEILCAGNKLVKNERNTCFLVVLHIQYFYELGLRRSNNIQLE